MELTSREILIYLANKYNGDWAKIYNSINQRETINDEEARIVLAKQKYKAITILDDEYPINLKNIYRPPFVLFYEGNISLLKRYDSSIAIVGSRQPSEYGRTNLLNIVKDLAVDFVVVSGCALGIDSIAQETCLKNGGTTIGVLGSPINYNYPKTSSVLINSIRKNGLVVSEYPVGNEIIPENFPTRNRIIVGLSKSVLVFDAREKSGTLSTATLTCNSNRTLMSIPYPLNSGFINNSFIKEGCELVENSSDIRFLMKMF